MAITPMLDKSYRKRDTLLSLPLAESQNTDNFTLQEDIILQ